VANSPFVLGVSLSSLCADADLDRLIQLDGQGAFTSGMQLYQYSKRHSCVGLSTNRGVRVIGVQDDYVCVYDSREPGLSACGWTHKDGLSR
jgi:hypothetical protein